MNVANLELCKELYELSGWGQYDMYYWSLDEPSGLWGLTIPVEHIDNNDIPAYDLGYLLRKLEAPGWKDGLILEHKADDEGYYTWRAACRGISEASKSPEDAACEMAIELFKQRILTK